MQNPRAATTSPGSAVGGLVLYDEASGNLEVYAVGTDGAVDQKVWNAAHGWSDWIDPGGSFLVGPARRPLPFRFAGCGGVGAGEY